MKRLTAVALVLVFVSMCSSAFAADKALFSFENDLQGWGIPDWAYEKDDHVAEELDVSNKYASDGKSSLEILADFPGGCWSGAYIENVEYFDWTPYSTISVDIYIPTTAPNGLKGKVILTQGEDWAWREMNRSVDLEPGQWTTVTADIKAGSTDWKRVDPDDSFRQDIRKFGIRVESNLRPIYKGPIYIDNIVLIE